MGVQLSSKIREIGKGWTMESSDVYIPCSEWGFHYNLAGLLNQEEDFFERNDLSKMILNLSIYKPN